MAVSLASTLAKEKTSFYFCYIFLINLCVAAECFHIYCRIGWQLTSGECWNTFRLCTDRIL